MRRGIVVFLAGIVFAGAAAAQLAPQKSSEGGVTITVTPLEVGERSKVWTFKVVMETHSQDLADDAVNIFVLTDERGRESKPISWQGAGPGGHHREGSLTFAAPEPLPEAIELRVTRSGEAAPRTMRWRLK